MTRVRLSRRQFIQGLGALSILPIVACADGVEQTPSAISVTAPGGYLMPDEGEPHSATWMAYGATWADGVALPSSRDGAGNRVLALVLLAVSAGVVYAVVQLGAAPALG